MKLGENVGRHRPKAKRSATDRLLEELRGSMVEALLDAARERRRDEALDPERWAISGPAVEHRKLAHAATHHALELAEKYLTLQGDV